MDRDWGLAASLMTALTVFALLLEAVLTALMRVDEMRAQLPLGAAVGASALLVASACRVCGVGRGGCGLGRRSHEDDCTERVSLRVLLVRCRRGEGRAATCRPGRWSRRSRRG